MPEAGSDVSTAAILSSHQQAETHMPQSSSEFPHFTRMGGVCGWGEGKGIPACTDHVQIS